VGDADGGVLERAAKPPLALAQRLLGSLALGLVLPLHDDADHPARVVLEAG
jgi:hypothetical protein